MFIVLFYVTSYGLYGSLSLKLHNVELVLKLGRHAHRFRYLASLLLFEITQVHNLTLYISLLTDNTQSRVFEHRWTRTLSFSHCKNTNIHSQNYSHLCNSEL